MTVEIRQLQDPADGSEFVDDDLRVLVFKSCAVCIEGQEVITLVAYPDGKLSISGVPSLLDQADSIAVGKFLLNCALPGGMVGEPETWLR